MSTDLEGRDPLAVELLVDPDKRRVTIDDHLAFRESLAPRPFDEIDELVSDIRAVESNREGIEA